MYAHSRAEQNDDAAGGTEGEVLAAGVDGQDGNDHTAGVVNNMVSKIAVSTAVLQASAVEQLNRRSSAVSSSGRAVMPMSFTVHADASPNSGGRSHSDSAASAGLESVQAALARQQVAAQSSHRPSASNASAPDDSVPSDVATSGHVV